MPWWGLAEVCLLAGWQQGLSPGELAGSVAAAEPVMEPAGELVAQDLAVAVAAAVAAAAVAVADVMLRLRASAWMTVAATAVVPKLPADLASVAVLGFLALAAGQWAQSGAAGSPSCCQRHDGMLTEHGMSVSNQQS